LPIFFPLFSFRGEKQEYAIYYAELGMSTLLSLLEFRHYKISNRVND